MTNTSPKLIRISNTDVEFDIGSCDKCDISVDCCFRPSRGVGKRYSVLYIIPSTSASEHSKGYGSGRRFAPIYKLNKEYAFDSYITSIVKCISKSTPLEYEIDNCNEFLKQEINLISPRIIVTVGEIVTRQFLKYTYFKSVVNKAHVIKLNGKQIIVFPIFHPNYDRGENDCEYNLAFERLAVLYKHYVDKLYINI